MHSQRPLPVPWVQNYETINSPSPVYVLRTFEWESSLFSESRVVHTADCPVEGKHSLFLICVIKPWGSDCVRAYWWLWVARLWKIFQQHWHKRQCSFPLSSLLLTWGTLQASCASNSSNLQAKSQFTSFLQKIILKKGTNQQNSCCVCFRQSSQVMGSDNPKMS